MATTTTNFGWDIPQSTDLVKDGATAIAALGQDIDTAFVDLKGGTTGQVLAKASNTDLDYTWVAQDDSNAIQNAIVDAKGDLIAASAADTPARLAVGNNGETLVADSSTSTGLRYQGSSAAGRNFIINGGFDIWQRGTSFTGANSNTYTADRWNMYFGVTPTAYTISQQSSGLTGFPYAIRVQRNNGATDTTGGAIGSSIEIANATYLAGQNIVFSFYARKGALFSGVSSYITASLKTGTGTTNANGIYNTYTGEATPILQNATITTTWQRFTYTATLGTSVTQAAIQFNAGGVGTAGATDYYEIAGVQVEIGSVATNFSRAGGTIQGELAACQRYYTRETVTTNYCYLKGFGNATTTSLARIIVPFAVQMRVKPTSMDKGVSLAVSDGANLFSTGSFVLSTNSTTQSAQVEYAHGSAVFTQFRYYGLQDENTGATYLGFSAEL